VLDQNEGVTIRSKRECALGDEVGSWCGVLLENRLRYSAAGKRRAVREDLKEIKPGAMKSRRFCLQLGGDL